MKEVTVEAKLENLDRALALVDSELESLDYPLKVQMQIDVAVEEMFVNVAHYAYAPESGPVTIRVETESAPPTLIVTLIDGGTPFDPLAKPDPDVTLPAEQRKIGGLGIFMVKKAMDDMKYQYADGKNIVTLRKVLPF